MAKQGRCWKCDVRYVYTKDRPLGKVQCPKCGDTLQHTTHCFQGETKTLET